MAQNRKPPAFQEYAATILADRNFRLMTLAERGLLFSMRLECWQNNNVPASPKDLAKYLGYEVSSVENALTDKVIIFFKHNGTNFISPEMEDYRQHLITIKQKQSDGGKKGAKIVNEIHKQHAGNSQVPQQDGHRSLVQLSSAEISKIKSIDNGKDQDESVSEWASEYERESNGI